MPPRVLSIVECGTRVALRLAPAPFRTAFGADLRHTVREVCEQAGRRGGAMAMVPAGARELLDLVRVALRARFGGAPPLQPPASSRRSPRKGQTMLQTLVQDVRLGVRSLAAGRAHTVISVLTLALGIGLTTSAFSVLDSLILRPVPFAGHERVVEIWNKRMPSGVNYPRFERRVFLEWRNQADLFDRVEGYEIESAIWKSPRGSEMVSGAFVTPGIFAMLGVPPLEGRYFGDGDGRDGTDAIVVVSERFWRERLGGGPGIVGSSLTFGGTSHTVVGVMPASFRFPNGPQEVWFPIDIEQPPARRLQGALSLTAYARMAPGVTLERLTAEIESRAARVLEATGRQQENLTASVHDPKAFIDRTMRQSLLVLAGAVGALLLIVCANVANMSLSRALGRARDFAVRASLGASRGDLVRETFVENALLGALGLALGLLTAYATLQAALVSLPPGMFISSLNEVDLDPRALGFATAVTIVTSVIFGLPPALIASRPAIADVLRRDSRSASGSRGSRRLRSALVVAEVTVSIVLLVGAALMVRSFIKLQAVDRGFEASELVAVRVGLPAAGYQDPRARDRFSDELVQALAQTPGITRASVGSIPPDSDLISFGNLEFEHAPDVKAEQIIVPIYRVWPDYFRTTGIPIAQGRPFEADEPRTSTIVSQSFADRYWPGRSAVGGRFRFTGSTTWREVVGVAGEVRQMDMDDRTGSFEFYYPLRTPATAAVAPPRSSIEAIVEYRTFIVRAASPAAVMEPARQTVTRLDENVVIWTIETVESNFEAAVARPRVLVFLLSLFAGLGLLFAAAGIYAVLSYLVGQRLREIGIRLALGASPREIFALVMRSGLTLTAAGLVIGIGAALALVRLMRAVLFEVEPTDPVSVALVSTLLVVVTLAASWRPARRAMRVDPMALLREQ